MADLSPAEIMLNKSTATQRLINRLQSVVDARGLPHGIKLNPAIKLPTDIIDAQAELQAELQAQIGELTAHREHILALVRKIPDVELQPILILHYGLYEKCTRKMKWHEVAELMNYSIQGIFKLRHKAIAELETILNQEGT